MMKAKKVITLIILMLTLGVMSGCFRETEVVDIYTTIYPIEFIAKNIVDGDLKVKSIYPRGKDVHDYELNHREMLRITKSKLIFYIGSGLEPVIEQSINTTLKAVTTVELSKNLKLLEINSDDVHSHHGDKHDDHDKVFYDPHVWLDLEMMQEMTDMVIDSILKTFDLTAEQIAKYHSNGEVLKEKFQKLDDRFFQIVSNENILNKTIIVDHDAYIYWQARYGIERIRIRNDNESNDVIVKEMLEKINQAKELKIKFICLTKNEMASSLVDQFVSQLGLDESAKVELHHLATITSQEEKAGEDYLSIMEYNLNIIDRILPRK